MREVADPYSGTLEDFQVCFSMIKEACDVLMKRMLLIAGSDRSEQEGVRMAKAKGGQAAR